MNGDQHSLIASLGAQEERLLFTRFNNAGAWRLGSATAENDSWIERKGNPCREAVTGSAHR
jgi:uncharacterized protein (UPF0303 family)